MVPKQKRPAVHSPLDDVESRKTYDRPITVAVIDSGIDSSHPSLRGARIAECISVVEMKDGRVIIQEGGHDEIGHGTAVAGIVAEDTHVEIVSIKVFQKALECTEQTLISALEYLERNLPCDVINISAGITCIELGDKLRAVCERLTKNGSHIVSAFDNAGGISYPAGFSCVIGVDTSESCVRPGQIEYVEGSIINILGRGGTRRVAWRHLGYNYMGGTSFAAAEVAQLICKYLTSGSAVSGPLASHLRAISITVHQVNPEKSVWKQSMRIDRATLLPYNKEIQSIVRSSDSLGFAIHSIHDVNVSGNVGRRIAAPDSRSSWLIQGMNSIDWTGDWDTLILGHVDQLSHISGRQIARDVLSKCAEYGKNVYSFDPISCEFHIPKGLDWRWPHVDEELVPRGRFGRLHHIRTPILGVFGTSPQQGKFTLQVFLRKYYRSRGYNVRQIGTEPSGVLFGMDFTFPMGYNSSVELSEIQMVAVLNEMLHCVDRENPDLIIVGGQSGTVPYDYGNLALYPLSQLSFLFGTRPDYVVLCLNPHDDYDYVIQTISAIESLVNSSVVALAMFPMGFRSDWETSLGTRVVLDDDTLIRRCKRVEERTGRFCVPMKSGENMMSIALTTMEALCRDD